MNSLDFSLNFARVQEGLTQSELATLDDCKMKWNLGYNNLVTRRGGWNWPMEVGTAFHSFAEAFYKQIVDPQMIVDPSVVTMEQPDEDVLQDSAFEADMEYWIGVLGAMQRAYSRLYHNDLELIEPDIIESVVTKEYRGFTFTAKIDLTGTSPQTRYFQMDHKSTSSLGGLIEDGWDFRLQFNFYPWMLSHKSPDTFIINGIRRPALRQTKAETHIAFVNRVAKDIAAKPLDYFCRTTFPINPERIRHFEKTVLNPKIDFLELAENNPELLVNKNTNHCRAYHTTCGFLPICRTSWEAEQFQYKIRDVKHVELVVE